MKAQQRMKNIKSAFKDLQTKLTEAAVDVKIANQEKENAEGKLRSLERQNNALEGMVVDMQMFREKADDYDTLMEKYERIKKIEGEFEIFKKEAKKLTKVNEDRDRLRRELLEEKKKVIYYLKNIPIINQFQMNIKINDFLIFRTMN